MRPSFRTFVALPLVFLVFKGLERESAEAIALHDVTLQLETIKNLSYSRGIHK